MTDLISSYYVGSFLKPYYVLRPERGIKGYCVVLSELLSCLFLKWLGWILRLTDSDVDIPETIELARSSKTLDSFVDLIADLFLYSGGR